MKFKHLSFDSTPRTRPMEGIFRDAVLFLCSFPFKYKVTEDFLHVFYGCLSFAVLVDGRPEVFLCRELLNFFSDVLQLGGCGSPKNVRLVARGGGKAWWMLFLCFFL